MKCRKDPKDPEEWQFAEIREVNYRDTQQTHSISGEMGNKMEAVAWMEARGQGALLDSPGKGQGSGQRALEDLGHGHKAQRKELLALRDGSVEEDPAAAKAAEAADEADVLSDIGPSQSKEMTAKRIQKMINLIKGLKGDLPENPALQTCLNKLQKLGKQGNKVKLESAKNELLEAALAVKRVSKKLKQ